MNHPTQPEEEGGENETDGEPRLGHATPRLLRGVIQVMLMMMMINNDAEFIGRLPPGVDEEIQARARRKRERQRL